MSQLKTLLLLISVFAYGQLTAQPSEPVKWTYSVKKVADDEALIVFNATVENKWHLYTQFFPDGGPMKLSFNFKESSNYKKIGKVAESPAPKKEMDEIFGIEVQYVTGKATFTQKVKILTDKNFTIKVEIEGQACNDIDGSCVPLYPEFEIKMEGASIKDIKEDVSEQNKADEIIKKDKDSSLTILQLDSVTKMTSVDTAMAKEKLNLKWTGKTPVIVTDNPYEDVKDDSSLFWFFLVAFVFGLAALLTPCVFPMVPMTVSFFMHDEENKMKARFNAFVYGISIVLIYTVPIAIITGISNALGSTSMSSDFANFLSTHWLPNIFFFLIFMVFAASFFGMFEIVLPHWLVNKSDEKASKGGLIGVFFMAFTLVLVSFSCTGPIVGGILVESTRGGEIIKPLVGMFGFSLGVALPFTIFAFFPEWLKKLPKSGGWLNSVKVVLGFLELALGLKFLSVADQTYHWGILDREVYIALWIVIFALMGFYLLGKIKFAHDSDLPFLKVPRLFLIIITFAFVIYLIPGMWGAPLKTLSGYLPPKSTHDFDLVALNNADQLSTLCEEPKHGDVLHLPHGLKGYFDVFQAFQCAKGKNKPIFIDFTGHGCTNCREMEANVWSDPRVLQILKEDYVILAMYTDDKSIELPEKEWFISLDDGKVKSTLGKQSADIQAVNFGKVAQPYYVLIDYDGVVLAEPRERNLNVNEYVQFLEKGKKNFNKRHKE